MNEKDFLQKIKEDAGSVTPPASLEPEAVERMLNDRGVKPKDDSQIRSDIEKKPKDDSQIRNDIEVKSKNDSQSRNKKTAKKVHSYRRIAGLGSIAAVFALCFTVLWQTQRIEKNAEALDNAPSNGIAADEMQSEEMSEGSADENLLQEAETASAETASLETDAPAESLAYASGYQEIYEALYDRFYNGSSALYETAKGSESLEYGEEIASMDMGIAEDSAADLSTADSDGSASSISSRSSVSAASAMDSKTAESSADYSGTNLQEFGVDEGDIVKTDGTYIYILRNDLSFAIVRADSNKLETASVTALDAATDACIQEMYLDEDTLSIILTEYVSSLEEGSSEYAEDIYYMDSKRQTRLLTYDITDRTAPVLTGSAAQDGSYEDSRKNGQYLYLFTSYYPNIADTYESSDIVPRIGGSPASPEDFYLPESLSDSAYLVISSVDTKVPGEILGSKILVSGVSHFYVSAENIYIANEKYDSGSTVTELVKFHYEDGQISGTAAGAVRGYLNNSFSMNEYDGMLRIVATYYGDEFNSLRDFVSDITGEYYDANWEEHNALYILDESLTQVGAIKDLAEGETIRSARFFGDIGYFVTFRQTDPLFSVDLTDPENPRILGELKISGFSSYLHFYGEDLLLGIGYEADEDTGAVSGIKLSMFDISDPADVKEIHRLTLPGITWCPAIEDYKSILVSSEKNLIGFFCDDRYLLFSYDPENGFASQMTYDFYSDLLMGEAEYNTMRGLYIGDSFYLAGETFVVSFDIGNGFEKTGLLKIE